MLVKVVIFCVTISLAALVGGGIGHALQNEWVAALLGWLIALVGLWVDDVVETRSLR